MSVDIRFVELWPSQAIHIASSAEMKIALRIIFNFAFNIKLRMCRVDLLTHWVYRELDWWNFLFSFAASVTSNIESNIKVLRLQDNFHVLYFYYVSDFSFRRFGGWNYFQIELNSAKSLLTAIFCVIRSKEKSNFATLWRFFKQNFFHKSSANWSNRHICFANWSRHSGQAQDFIISRV